MYHYAGNNPVKYKDPTGKFDVEEFKSSCLDLFSSRDDKYSEFNDYKIDRYISSDECEYYSKNPEQLGTDSEIFYRESKNRKEYCIATKTNFGKMSKEEKLNAIANEYNKAISKFGDNKDSIKDAFESLGYGTGEALFNIAQNGSVEEFIGNYLLSNIETIGDFAQYDLDGVNILMDMRYLEKKYDFVQKNY